MGSIGWLGNMIYYDCKNIFHDISHYSSSKDRALAFYSLHTLHSHFPLPPAPRKIIDKRMLIWSSAIGNGRSKKSRLMGVIREAAAVMWNRSSVKREVSTSCVVVVDCNDISPSRKPIPMELYQVLRYRQRLPLLL